MKVGDKVIFIKDIRVPPCSQFPGFILAVKYEAAMVVRMDTSKEYPVAVKPVSMDINKRSFGVNLDEIQVVL